MPADRFIRLRVGAIVLGFTVAVTASATAPNDVHQLVQQNTLPSGSEIARRINDRDEGRSVKRHLTMELTDKRGKRRVRQTVGYRDFFGDERRTVIFFLSPKNIRNTAFLTYDYAAPTSEDDQWLYLPATRKVRRISAANRGDYFLGTDMTYEDIKLETRVSLSDYTYRTTGESTVDGHHCYLVEALPVNRQTARELGYGRALHCVDDKIWMVRHSKVWDIKDNLLKTIHATDIRQVQGIWTQHKIDVKNHKTGHQSLFIFTDVDYESTIPSTIFSQNALKKGL